LLFQMGLGWGPLETGLVTVGTAVGAMACKPVTPGFIRRFGFRSTLLCSNLLTGALTALPAFFRASTPAALMVLALGVAGFMRSLQFTALNTVAYADIPPNTVSNASTLSVVTQQMGLSLGISFGGLMLHVARGGGEGAITPQQFILPFVAVGVVTVLAGPLFRRMSPEAGASIRGQRSTAEA
jgi:Na+/melibiose symporter-like transporter